MEEFYLNQPSNHECFKLPEKDKKYLLRNNFLNEYFSDKDKAQVRSNLGIDTLLDELKGLILAKLFDEEGNVTFDLEPHEDAFDKVLSSAVIYNILLKYYTKEELDEWRESLIGDIYNKIQELEDTIHVDNQLDENSEYPILNKVLYQIISLINSAYSRLSLFKVDREELFNYYNIDEINALLNDLRRALIEYADTKDAAYYTKELTFDILQDYATNSSVLEEVNGIKLDIQSLSLNIENVLNLSETVETMNQALEGINLTVNETVSQSLGEINLDIEFIQEDILKMPKYVFLTLAQYEALSSYDDNTLYFIIIESNSEGSQFGDTFPLTFG